MFSKLIKSFSIYLTFLLVIAISVNGSFILNLFSISNSALAVDTIYKEEQIDLYDVDINIKEDGTVDITEEIHYYFPTERHGIYRTIPLVKENQDGKEYLMSISDVSVLDRNGKPINFENLSTSDKLELKIGSADILIKGSYVFKISYTVLGALTYFSDHDELYWNVTGNEWEVPISKYLINISIPESKLSSLNPEEYFFEAICYTGSFNSTLRDCDILKKGSSEIIVKPKSNTNTTNVFNPYEGITIAVKFPKNLVSLLEPSVKKNYDWFYALIFGLIALIYYFITPIFLLFKFLKNTKKWPEEYRVIAAWFDAPKIHKTRFLTAAETGTIVDNKTDIRDISSTIIQLAQRGYLIIEETNKKISLFSSTPVFKLLRTEKSSIDLLEFEKLLLDYLFLSKTEVTTKELSNRLDFSLKLNNVMKSISSQLKKDGLFNVNIYTHKQNWSGILVLSLLSLNILLFIVSLLNYFKLSKTKEGATAIATAKSLKNFLVSQEDQYKFQAKNKMMFEKLLPYAISFGVEKIWIDRFKDIMVSPPDWYVSSGSRVFSYDIVSSSLNKSITNASRISSSRSSTGHSSGFSAGFSGGGGGGGGGRSW